MKLAGIWHKGTRFDYLANCLFWYTSCLCQIGVFLYFFSIAACITVQYLTNDAHTWHVAASLTEEMYILPFNTVFFDLEMTHRDRIPDHEFAYTGSFHWDHRPSEIIVCLFFPRLLSGTNCQFHLKIHIPSWQRYVIKNGGHDVFLDNAKTWSFCGEKDRSYF